MLITHNLKFEARGDAMTPPMKSKFPLLAYRTPEYQKRRKEFQDDKDGKGDANAVFQPKGIHARNAMIAGDECGGRWRREGRQ
jgi:hypothetical protein